MGLAVEEEEEEEEEESELDEEDEFAVPLSLRQHLYGSDDEFVEYEQPQGN